jgi:hypothetical protein
MNHGYATLKRDFYGLLKGDGGVITAYLPEDNTFAVHFGKKGWHTFKMTFEEFYDLFEVERGDNG